MRMMLAVAVVLGLGCGDKKKSAEKPAPGASGSATAGAAIDARAELGGIDVPVVAAPHGLVALDDNAIVVAATMTRLIVDGTVVIELVDAAVDAADLEGGASGMMIPRLAQLIGTTVQIQDAQTKRDDPAAVADPIVVIVADRRAPAKLVTQIVYSSNKVGVKRFAIAAVAGGQPMMVPLTLPDLRPSASAPGGMGGRITIGKPGDPDANLGPPMPVQPVASIRPGEVMLWSISGILGTLREPRLRLTDPATAAAALSKELAAFVAARWPAGATRTDEERTLVILPESTTPLEAVVPVMAAARADDKGAELFPTLMLSSGFE